MNNYLQPGTVLTLTAPTGGVVSGSVYKVGQLLVVAAATVAQTLPFEGQTEGVFTIVKVAGQAWTEGALVYWDDTAKNFTTTASGNLLAGVATAAALTAATSATVRLNGIGSSDIP